MENNNQNFDPNYQAPSQEPEYGYQAPQYNPNQYTYNEPVAPVMSVKDWILSLLIMLIPCVNIIMMFVWAFSKTENPNKSNYFKAYLIFTAISLVISLIFTVAYVFIIGAAIGGAAYM